MAQKLPYGLKRYLIEKTGRSYHDVSRVLSGESGDISLIREVKELLAEYNKTMRELCDELSAL